MAKLIDTLKSRLLFLFVIAFLPGILFALYLSIENHGLSRYIFIVIGIFFFGLCILYFGVNSILLKPVEKILRASRRIELGDLSARIDSKSMLGEVRDTAESFNKIAGEIEIRETALKKNEAEILKQAVQMKSLMEIGRKINHHLDIKLVLQNICEEIIRALCISACSIRLYDQDREAFFLVAQSGLPDSVISHATQLDFNVYKYHCIEEDNFVRFHEPNIDPALPDDLNEKQIGADILAIKMMQEDSPIGLLILYIFPENVNYKADDLLFIDGVAGEASLAILNAKLYQNLQQEQNKKLGLVQRLISIQEDERIHIARELHDVTSQNLSAVRVLLDTITLSQENPNPKALLYIKSIRMIIDTILEDTHRMISNLRPSILDDLGLVAAISWFAEERLSPAGIGYQFKHANLECRFSTMIETTLFRIFQEVITNIVSHSKASCVDILLYQENNSAVLIVSDNGLGFDPSMLKSSLKPCYGLTGIEERVNSLDGKYLLNSSKNHGTSIEIVLPILEGC